VSVAPCVARRQRPDAGHPHDQQAITSHGQAPQLPIRSARPPSADPHTPIDTTPSAVTPRTPTRRPPTALEQRRACGSSRTRRVASTKVTVLAPDGLRMADIQRARSATLPTANEVGISCRHVVELSCCRCYLASSVALIAASMFCHSISSNPTQP